MLAGANGRRSLGQRDAAREIKVANVIKRSAISEPKRGHYLFDGFEVGIVFVEVDCPANFVPGELSGYRLLFSSVRLLLRRPETVLDFRNNPD